MIYGYGFCLLCEQHICMQERIVSLDIAKAICIVLVVIGHYAPDNAPHWYEVMHDMIYTFHMPLFMFASGYIYIATKRGDSYGSFLLRKARRLMMPYLATSAIIITLKLLTQGHAFVENPVTILAYVRMFYLPEAGYFLWFVWALWWMFVIVSLLRTRGSRLALLVVALVLHFLPISFTKVFCLSEFKAMLVYFMIGVSVFEYRMPRQFVMTLSKYQAVCITLLFASMEALRISKIGGGRLIYLCYKRHDAICRNNVCYGIV